MIDKELEKALSDIEKRFGKGSVMNLSGHTTTKIDVVSTKCPSIDLALGIKGIPKGRITEIYGAESSGKTTLALQVIAEAQKNGDTCAYLDVEHALDPAYASKLGVDLDTVIISQPDSAENTLEIAEALIESGQVKVVVVDSVAAMVPQSEINGEFGDAQMGVMARLMSQAMRKLNGPISKHNVAFIFINQTRSKIGVMWGSPTTTSGGVALKFYASIRIEVTKIGQLKDGDSVIGNRTRVKIVKNKLAAPFKEAEFDMIFGEGISKESDILNLAIDKGIIEQKGSWFSYGEEKLGQGKENIRKMLKENGEFYNELEKKVYENV